MRRIVGWSLVLALATVGPPRLAHAGSFGGFGAGGAVLDDDTRSCEPLVVGPDGVAIGRPRCRAVAAAERASFKRPDAAAAAAWAGTAKRRDLVVSRGGKKVVTWTAPQDLDRVVAVHVGEGGNLVAVEVKTRNGTLLVPFRIGGGGAPVAPAPAPGPSPVPAPGGAGKLPMDIAEGTWRQAAVPCERAGVTLELTATQYALVIETRCQSSRDKLRLSGAVRPGKISPIELVLENDGGPEEAWPCAPKPCEGGTGATCLACSDGEDGFELTRDPKSAKAKSKPAAKKKPVAAPR